MDFLTIKEWPLKHIVYLKAKLSNVDPKLPSLSWVYSLKPNNFVQEEHMYRINQKKIIRGIYTQCHTGKRWQKWTYNRVNIYVRLLV